jgi:3-oxoacyl-[acyl-carrier protein] reductase
MQIDLTGKTALVTGGSVGIGKSIALALAECGAHVALTYLTHPEDGESVATEIRARGGTAHAYQLDATDSSMVDAAVRQAAIDLGGHIDILMNNAGHLVGRVKIDEMSDEHWHKVIDVNVTSAFYVTRSVLNYMQQGRIVLNSSLAGRNGGSNGAVAYATAKAALFGMTRGLAKELAPRGITVNAVAPGFIIDTPFHETFTGVDNYQNIINTIPLKRAGVPNDVANAVLYFVSDMGAWVTGQVAEINGGAWFV